MREGTRPRRRKSLLIAFLLWFFFGIVAAHKFYLGRVREGLLLILAYFFLPLGAMVAAVLILRALGVRLLPEQMRPEDVRAMLESPLFIGLTGLVLAVLTAIWIWDFRVLLRQVREHNEAVERGEREASGKDEIL